jgi:hypothetical protein
MLLPGFNTPSTSKAHGASPLNAPFRSLSFTGVHVAPSTSRAVGASPPVSLCKTQAMPVLLGLTSPPRQQNLKVRTDFHDLKMARVLSSLLRGLLNH